MEAIILAGGFGTRIAHIVSDVPKPMASVCGRPFLRFIVDDLIEKGVTRIVMAVGYKKDTITDFFGSSYRGVEIAYSCEDKPLGTGGAIKQALGFCKSKRVFIINGDTFYDVNLGDMFDYDNEIVIAAKMMHDFSRYGTVDLDLDNKVVKFREKTQTEKGLINGGIYLLNRNILNNINQESFSFETEVLEKCVETGSISAHISEGYFIDIGVPEDYEQAQTGMSAYVKQNKIAFFDRDGTINVDVGYLHQPKDMQFIDGMPQFIKNWNDWGYKVVVITNQAGISRGYYNETDMHELHIFMNEKLGEFGAHIDAFYFCPHHPDVTGECDCRKPKPGMIKRALFEFDGDAKKSIMFGDKPWDVEAAEACGVFGALI